MNVFVNETGNANEVFVVSNSEEFWRENKDADAELDAGSGCCAGYLSLDASFGYLWVGGTKQAK